MTLGEAIAAVKSEGGFDSASTATPTATIRGWIWESVQTALAKSKYRRAALELGPAVSGTADYALPDHVLDVNALRVGAGLPYMEIPGIETLWALEAGRSTIWPGGFLASFGDDADADADLDTLAQVKLWPTPGADQDGLPIVADCAVSIPTESTDDAYVIPLPLDVVRAIAVDGAIAIGRERVDERPDLAAGFAAKAESATGELVKRAQSRVGGRRAQLRLTRPRIV